MSEKQFRERVKGESEAKRDRDYKILETLALQPELTQDDVIKLLDLNLTQGGISTILNDNMKLYLDMVMRLNPLALEEGRALELITLYRRKKKIGTKKDIADLLEQIRREVKGDKPVIDQSVHNTLNVSLKELEGKDERELVNLVLGRK